MKYIWITPYLDLKYHVIKKKSKFILRLIKATPPPESGQYFSMVKALVIRWSFHLCLSLHYDYRDIKYTNTKHFLD